MPAPFIPQISKVKGPKNWIKIRTKVVTELSSMYLYRSFKEVQPSYSFLLFRQLIFCSSSLILIPGTCKPQYQEKGLPQLMPVPQPSSYTQQTVEADDDDVFVPINHIGKEAKGTQTSEPPYEADNNNNPPIKLGEAFSLVDVASPPHLIQEDNKAEHDVQSTDGHQSDVESVTSSHYSIKEELDFDPPQIIKEEPHPVDIIVNETGLVIKQEPFEEEHQPPASSSSLWSAREKMEVDSESHRQLVKSDVFAETAIHGRRRFKSEPGFINEEPSAHPIIGSWKIENAPNPEALRKGLQEVAVHFINNAARVSVDESPSKISPEDVYGATVIYLDKMIVPAENRLSKMDFEEQHLNGIFRSAKALEDGSLDTLDKALTFTRNTFKQLELAVGDRANPLYWPSLKRDTSNFINSLKEIRNQADLNLSKKHGFEMVEDPTECAGGPPEAAAEACGIKTEKKEKSSGDGKDVKGCRRGRGGKRGR